MNCLEAIHRFYQATRHLCSAYAKHNYTGSSQKKSKLMGISWQTLFAYWKHFVRDVLVYFLLFCPMVMLEKDERFDVQYYNTTMLPNNIEDVRSILNTINEFGEQIELRIIITKTKIVVIIRHQHNTSCHVVWLSLSYL